MILVVYVLQYLELYLRDNPWHSGINPAKQFSFPVAQILLKYHRLSCEYARAAMIEVAVLDSHAILQL